MTTDSPVVVLFNSDGYEVNVKPNVAIPTGTTAILAAGSDGTNSRFVTVDITGRPIVVGAGTAGSPVGGVVSVQGVSGGQAIPISGTVTATNASTGATGASPPSQATYVAGLSTTSAPSYTNNQLNALSLTLTGALRIDGSAVTQPVSGTVTANQGGTWNINNISGTITLPTGAATEATLATLLTTSAFQTRINTLGQKTMANSTPVVLASDQSAIPVSQNGSWTVGAAQSGTWTVQPGNVANTTPWLITINQGGNSATVTASNALKVDGSAVTQPVSGTVAATQSGAWTVTANAGTGNFTVIGTGTDNTTNSTAKLPVLPARANTSAPTWTDGNMVPLSVDTAGAVRVTGTLTANNASVSTTGTAPPASATYIGGSVTTAAPSYTTGQMNALSLTTSGLLRIDGSGVTQPVSGTVTANQGTANTLANRWPVIVTDGTNTMPTADTAARSSFHRITDGTNTATVKAASTAAVVGDTALVVAVSPNNSVTVTQATAANLNAQVVGPGASGAAVSGNPVRVAGSDGTNTRNILTDTSGRLINVGAAASGAAVTGNPVLVAGSDGTNARTILTTTNGTVYVKQLELATFASIAANITQGNNKSMLSLLNASGSGIKLSVKEIYIKNSQVSAVSGVAGVFEIRRFTGHTAGTLISIVSYDTTDSLSGSVTSRTGSTISGETDLLSRWEWSTDDWGPGTLDQEGLDHTMQSLLPAWSQRLPGKGMTLNPGEGLHIKFATNSTAGSWDLRIVFTQE